MQNCVRVRAKLHKLRINAINASGGIIPRLARSSSRKEAYKPKFGLFLGGRLLLRIAFLLGNALFGQALRASRGILDGININTIYV